jgi:EmrB/QacA subfamily drug resistance transporter
MLVIFLFAIDGTIVSTAMPTVVAKLGGLELYGWVFSIYMLTSALSTPLSGKLSDLFNRQRLMLIGIGIFMVGSALCGAAQSMTQLIVFRAIQGVGGGTIYALSFIIVGVMFPREKRAKMQGLISSIWGVSSVLGPLGGGVITEYWSWRWIFFVNLPVAFVATALIILGFSESEVNRGQPRLDFKGAVTLLLGLLLLFSALQQSSKTAHMFNSALLGLLALATLLLFFILERHSEEPIMPPDLFSIRLFGTSTVLVTLASMGIFGVISYLPLYIQGVLGGSASLAGTALLLASLGWTAGSFIGGQGMNRLGYRKICVVGMALMVLGYGLFITTSTRLGLVAAFLDGFLIGMGMGIVNVTSLVAAQNGVPMNRIGVATSTVMLFRTFGGAFGISLMGSVLFSQMHRQLIRLSDPNFPATLMESFVNPQNLMEPSTRSLIPKHLLPSLVDALSNSLWYAFLAGLIIMLVGFALSLFITDQTPASTPHPADLTKAQTQRR